MAKEPKKKGKKKKQHNVPTAGSSPGLLYIDESALPSIITVHSYGAGYYEARDVDSILGLKPQFLNSEYTYWIDVKGLKSATLFEALMTEFNIHKLVLEDITRTSERPKYEEYEGYDFAVSRMLYVEEEFGLCNEQVSYILMQNVLITFQEGQVNGMDPVRARLKAGKGNIRTAGSSYLMYAIMDVVIDKYFIILNAWGDELDRIDDELIEKPDRSLVYIIQGIKRNLISMRRVAWAERDKLNDILRSDSHFITAQTKMFTKDAYDHSIQTIEMVESLKEICISSMDMYLSLMSNRTNHVMKVLTIISSIFIPLTFIAGIYGMNFAKQDPVTGKNLPANMPELYNEHGYLYTMAVMAIIAIIQLFYFWRKGWFK
ncbi:magnesium/cobalt transporter CorA [Pedobacter sp.]|uniref:magnesium/cobalt transporter CorA n=1 Tax=Pedobacter sp. TaxID=1411316 RepID=UPI003D7F4DBE